MENLNKRLQLVIFGLLFFPVPAKADYEIETKGSGRICEHEYGYISCQCGKIYVSNAFYGTTPPNRCAATTRRCGQSVKSQVGHMCDKKETCSLHASNDIIGDPCDGTLKYLEVSYKCTGGTWLPKPADCNKVTCHSKNNVWCTKCNSELLFELQNGKCYRKCSWENRWCWPGHCSGNLITGCVCAKGFNSAINSNKAVCQPALPPVIDSCQVKAFGINGSVEACSHEGSPKCSFQSDFYGRFQVRDFSVDLMANYIVQIDEKSRPGYVPRELFGVTDVDIEVVKVSVKRTRKTLSKEILKQDKNSEHPQYNYVNKTSIKITEDLHDGEKLCLRYNIKGGGYLVSKNLISTNHTTTHIPYDKTSISKEICYIYDRMKPKHCSEDGSCRQEPLQLSNRLTKSQHLKIQFKGWQDPYPSNGNKLLASGIEMHEINIYEVKQSSPTTLMRDTKTIKNYTLSPNVTEYDITLPDKNPMLYVIFMKVKDRANNVRQTRRFVLYDNTSFILKNDKNPFKVVSASEQSNNEWQVNNTKLCFSWNNHFYNDKLKGFLRPVKRESLIQESYDQTTGLMPINGTRNVNGIIEYSYSLNRNDKTSVLHGTVQNFTSETICLGSDMTDGDKFVLHLQARDIMNHTLNDSVSVKIDRSVPEITDVWLSHDGHEQIYVHHSKDLSLMSLIFKTIDIHSGIKEVKWAFGVYENKTVLINKGIGVMPAENWNTCVNETSCYCPIQGNCSMTTFTAHLSELKSINKHIGNHNRRYFFSIKAINNAFLTAVAHVDILVDESPPEVGVVLEGPIGSPDIDYTAFKTVTVHWHGFIDHESGIKMYRIALGKTCMFGLESIEPGKNNESLVVESSHTSITMTFPDGKGQYFVSVIAFNNAMSPSKVVCSDGVTFDTSVPRVHNLTVKHAKTVESIACHNGTTWLIKEHLSKTRIIGDTCSSICRNESDDKILNVLPQVSDSQTDIIEISSFLCSTVKRYKSNIIYTPSDLFQISWNITEDYSQIADVYIGFGSDISEIDSPNIIDYNKVHHRSYYIQRHPGLIGEETVYLFLKVKNRAGLENKVWFGPVLADETSPICPEKINAFVEEGHIVVTWNNSSIFDAEQTEEIGQVMFRIGVKDRFITPFLEWNIQSHGGQCEVGYQCIKYPIKRLQNYDSIQRTEFYIQLHVYNYAGHFCSVDSVSIQLPSIFPPRHGIVLDVYPGTLPPYHDIDVIFNTTEYCFAWRGFHHHENVKLEAGLGRCQENKGAGLSSCQCSDDVIPFYSIVNSEPQFSCEKSQKLSVNTKYCVSIKASCSGGTTYVSSDGFTILNEKEISQSLKVFHGQIADSHNSVKIISIDQISNNLEKVKISDDLIPGLTYSLKLPVNISVEIKGTNVYVKKTYLSTTNKILTFIPLLSTHYLTLKVDNVSHDDIQIYRRDYDMEYQTSTTLLQIHWTIPQYLNKFATHYETGLCQSGTGMKNCKDKTIFTFNGKQTYKEFHGQFKGLYRAGVRPCFTSKCLSPIWSTGVRVQSPLGYAITKHASAEIQTTCLNTSITIEKFTCSADGEQTVAIGYRWAIFSDGNEQRMMTRWKLVMDNNSTIQDSICVEIPVYHHSQLYVCAESFCVSGISKQTCSLLNINNDPNTYDKTVLYDLNLYNPATKDIEKIKYSQNIGNNLGRIHNLEMDFADTDVTIGGFIAGLSEVTVVWYLMKKPLVPNVECSLDPKCLVTMTTSSGFVDFNNKRLEEKGIFYICAVIQQISSTNDTEICSDGFLVDNNPPGPGVVSIKSLNGYVTDGSELTARWNGFKGNHLAKKLGYPSDIAYYQLSLGTHPGSDDILNPTLVGLTQSKTIKNLNLQLGQPYYASVQAFNHINKSAESYSEAVIFDNTPPSQGQLCISTRGFNSFVSTRSLSLNWAGIDDNESGIRKIEIGIGSSNSSIDVMEFKQFLHFAEIDNHDYFQDGHQYFAVLKATNGAGLISYTVSAPFVIDNSPPEVGHVMDGLRNTSKFQRDDNDYQTETNHITCAWYGFHDSHSYTSGYKVGLGTTPGDDDVMAFTSVGLETLKTYRLAFQQGVKYYCTVIGCNEAGLCNRSTSNGIIIDNSVPVPGKVFVGDQEKHTRYLSDRTTVHASWVGFEDPQSGIDHFEVCVGTSASKCDVMERLDISLSSSFLRSNLNMPVGVRLFMSVRACNKVNMCVQRSSDSFVIDDTPPNIITKPYINSIHQDTSGVRHVISDPSFFIVKWRFIDSESPILRTTVSIYSRIDSHVPLDDMTMSNENETVVQLLRSNILRQGDIYTVKVTACNAALLCQSTLSGEILVDYTPPKIGGFMSPLQYEIISTDKLLFNLTCYGFEDTESNIRAYYVTIGYTYSGSELIDSHMIRPALRSVDNVQQTQIPVKSSSNLPDDLVITIWAENYAGLNSSLVKVTTTVLASDYNHTKGDLLIQKHSCTSDFCNNDCTCSVVGKKCKGTSKASCVENKSTLKSELNLHLRLLANDVNNKTIGSSKCLGSEWSMPNNSSIFRFEYSFGVHGEMVGYGVYNLSIENAWYDIGHGTKAFYCLDKDVQLQHQKSYVAYVRAWISFPEYVVFESTPITVDHSPPVIHKRHFVIDGDSSCDKDVDFITSSDFISTCWDGVFSDEESGIDRFIVSLGTYPALDDIVRNTDVGMATYTKWTGYSLEPGVMYYSTVRAVNTIGLQTEVSSDGFMVDNTASVAGIVYNTGYHHDVIYQSVDTPVQFSWHGFDDDDSFVDSYSIEVIVNDEKPKTFTNIGIINNYRYHGKVQHNDKISASVKAIDKAGHESSIVTSHPLYIDATPPQSFLCDVYNDVDQHNNTATANGEYTWFHSNTFNSMDIIKVTLEVKDIRVGYRAYLTIGDMFMNLPFTVTAQGPVVSEYIYLSQQEKKENISINLYNTKPNTFLNITLSKCSKFQLVTNSTRPIMVQQISRDSVSICVPTIDIESGIKQIQVGVGSVPDGLELYSLRSISTRLHDVIQGNFTHGMPIYIKGITENHAGLVSVIRAKPLIIDHTRPHLLDVNSSVNYVLVNNNTMSIIQSRWQAMDEESTIKYCEYCLGLLRSSCDLSDWIRTNTLRSFQSKAISLQHGVRVHGTVRCINDVELTGQEHIGPLTISVKPPFTENPEIQFITDNINNGETREDRKSVTARWKEFSDLSGFRSYKVNILHDNTDLVTWKDIGKGNYIRMPGLTTENKNSYTMEIKAVNIGGMVSKSINGSVEIDNMKPSFTGHSATVDNISGNKLTVDWSNVFVPSKTITSYEVAIGSIEGATDVLMPTSTSNNQLTLQIPRDVKDLYLVVTAITDTDVSRTFRQTIIFR